VMTELRDIANQLRQMTEDRAARLEAIRMAIEDFN